MRKSPFLLFTGVVILIPKVTVYTGNNMSTVDIYSVLNGGE